MPDRPHSPPEALAHPDRPGRRAWRAFAQDRWAMAGAGLLGCWIAAVAFAGVLRVLPVHTHLPGSLSWSPEQLSAAQLEPPSPEHWMGTDIHGRDLCSRVLYGAGISFLVGTVGALLSLGLGVACGAVAGFVGGRIDELLMRAVDLGYALPAIVLVVVVMAVIEPLLQTWAAQSLPGISGVPVRLILLVGCLGAVSWLNMARGVRGQVLSLRTRGFVEASRALGAGNLHIFARHLLPNLTGVIMAYLTLTVPSVILYESFLSYLGLGIQPPQASLGYLIADGATALNTVRSNWWLVVFPATTLAALLLALNLVGDGLRDAWDPHTPAQARPENGFRRRARPSSLPSADSNGLP